MTTGSDPQERPNERKELGTNGLHLLALVGFAIAQPLFEVLQRDATFFVARRSQGVDLVALALALVLLPPLALLGVEFAVGLLSRSLRRGLHLVLVSALATLIFLPPLKRLGEGAAWVLPVAVAGGVLATLTYARAAPVRTLLTVLSPASLGFAVLFLLNPSIAKLLGSAAERAPPASGVDSETTVVMVVLDELPVTSLLDESLQIDPSLFPNFARLASRATWFRNATGNHNASEHAVPALLTGCFPSRPELLPIEVDHPRNLFALLSGSHRMNVWETFSGLRPPRDGAGSPAGPTFGTRARALADDLVVVYGHVVLPDRYAAHLPPVGTKWGGFNAEAPPPADEGPEERRRGHRTHPFASGTGYEDRAAVFRAFVASIDESEAPSLHFLHTILPHSPWENLPTGQRYTHGRGKSAGFSKYDQWTQTAALAALGYQRHLLQLGHIDALLGELIDRLERLDLYDESLVVLVADHGCSFRVGEPFRGGPVNARDVMHVPLIVKQPFQAQPRTSDRNVQAIDVLPTIADGLGIALPWEVDGTSALDSSVGERPEKTFFFLHGEPLQVPGAIPTEWPLLAEKLRLFGSAPGWEGVYAMGPHPEHVGRTVRELEVLAPMRLRAEVHDQERFASVDVEADVLPVLVEGEVFRPSAQKLGPKGFPTEIAVAINGTLQGVTSTYRRSTKRASFSVVVSPDAFENGRNSIEVFGLFDGSTLAPLREIVYTLEADRIVGSDGRSYELRPNALQSSVAPPVVSKLHLTLTGWAADLEAGLPAETMVLFLDGAECVFSGSPNSRRPELEKQLGKRARAAGFEYGLPIRVASNDAARRLRLFALLGDVACELELQ